eukprot:XP_001694026.1 predicted protein [Chlamydomonas reinhardtii]
MGHRNPGLLQALLDAAFGSGRFAAAAAPDHLLLRDSCTAVAAELEAGVHAVLTAASRPAQQQAELLARLEGILAQATPERRLQLLVTTAEVVEAVAPGSDAHVTAAVKVWGGGRCGEHGAASARG